MRPAAFQKAKLGGGKAAGRKGGTGRGPSTKEPGAPQSRETSAPAAWSSGPGQAAVAVLVVAVVLEEPLD
eukprot:4513287-Lingulodinium_polyedra.AAC.1